MNQPKFKIGDKVCHHEIDVSEGFITEIFEDEDGWMCKIDWKKIIDGGKEEEPYIGLEHEDQLHLIGEN